MSWASWAAGTIRTATAIAREMKDRTEQDRREPRPAGGAGSGARRHVKRDDHDYRPSRRPRETRAEATSRTWRAVRPQDTPAEIGVAFPPEGDIPRATDRGGVSGRFVARGARAGG